MYTKFFRLTENPFRLTPDPRFLYFTPRNREALASLIFGVLAHKGFMMLTGDAGTGKTTLIHALLEMLHEKKAACAFIFHPVLEPAEFLDYVLADLGIPTPSQRKGEMLRALHAFLLKQHEANSTTVLIIDEAHKLPLALLEEIRLFSNLETSRDKLIQIVLAGQSELDDLFRREEMRQLKQRISLRSRLEPFSLTQTAEYIDRRTSACGRVASDLFPAGVLAAIHDLSRGIPRLINSICDNSLLLAFAQNAPVVTAGMVTEVGIDLDLCQERTPAEPTSAETSSEQPAESRLDVTEPPAVKQETPAVTCDARRLAFLESYAERTKIMDLISHWAQKFRLSGKPAQN